MIQRTLTEIKVQINNVMSDYLREQSDRTLGYLQLLLTYYSSYQKPIDFMDKPLNELPITKMGQGRTDAIEWLHLETINNLPIYTMMQKHNSTGKGEKA